MTSVVIEHMTRSERPYERYGSPDQTMKYFRHAGCPWGNSDSFRALGYKQYR